VQVPSERAGAEFWLSAAADDVRPYGFLVRRAPSFASAQGKWFYEVCYFGIWDAGLGIRDQGFGIGFRV